MEFVVNSLTADLEKQEAAKDGKLVISLDAREFKDKHALLKIMAFAFNFPGYFGYNWDALEECMRDIDDFLPNAEGWLLVIDHAAGFKKEEELFPVLYSVLEGVNKEKQNFAFVFVDR